ncbi:UNVERIFIED_CONTAM: hypothetical protein Sradi_3750800 [Sesamum radiatum]|uniref:Uncharacterized protein n=1 Tax=Sesamum radiatum TaxID=300843 RepID=A0AAW2PYS8_SESRA
MADRRSSFSLGRFWSISTRRSSTNQTTAAPPATTNSAPRTAPRAESPNVSQSTTNTNSPVPTAPPPAETQTPGNQSIAAPASSSSTTTQTSAPQLATTTAPTTPGAESQNVSQSIGSTTATPTTNETTTQGSQSTTTASSPPNPTTPSTKEQQITDHKNTTAPAPTPPPSGKAQTASQTNNTIFTGPANEPKTSMLSPATTRSPSSLQPKSPSRQIAQSRAPPQARSTVSSPSRMGSQSPTTTQRASQPHSPSRLSSRSPKQTPSTSSKGIQPNSPSKEARHTTQQEPQLKAEAKSDSAKNFNGETVDGTSSKNDEVKAVPSKSSEVGTTTNSAPGSETPMPTPKSDSSNMNGSSAEVKSESANHSKSQTVDEISSKRDEVNVTSSKSSELGTSTTPVQGLETPTPTQKLDSSTVNGEHKPVTELTAKPEETQEVKEVVQETKVEINEETKKEVNHILTPKSGSGANIIEKGEIPSKPNPKNAEKQEAPDTKEILPTPVPSVKQTNTPTSQLKKRSMISDTQKISARPSGEHVALHKDIRDDLSTFVDRMTAGDPKTAINDKPVSVITLAGENRGASMQMGSNSSRTEGPVHIHRGYKINPDETAEATTDGEGSSNKGKKSEDAKITEDHPKEVYVNNNAQGINNSIVFNVSITERNPGVHISVAHAPKESIQSTGKRGPPETRKAEFNMNRMERLTYEPKIRRRCLRGLFLEPSDSDPENPEKPRRHGCRVGCQQRDKEDVDVL